MNEQKSRQKKRKTTGSQTEASRPPKSAGAGAKRTAKAGVNEGPKNASGSADPAYEKLEEAGQTIRNVLNEVTQKAEEMEKNLRQRLSDKEISLKNELARTEDKIRENPLLAVGIAAAAGLIVGLLLNRNQ